MKSTLAEVFQINHNFAIVDEVDSILIDEARTPLIISGPADDRSELYISIDKLIPLLEENHYEIDEKTRNVTFTDDGNDFLEEQLRARESSGSKSSRCTIPKARPLCTTSIRVCGRISCSGSTRITLFATARLC